MPIYPPIERASDPIDLSIIAQSASVRIFFGGTFSPPHLGHTRLPEYLPGILGHGVHTIYVPASRSPLKSSQPIAKHHRLNMLKLALQNQQGWEIWEQELQDASMNPNQPSYWADTWAIVQRMELPGINKFLIGADQALSMHRWRRYLEFWKDAFVMLREGFDSADVLINALMKHNVWSNRDIEHWRGQILVLPMIRASSTDIRTALHDHAQRTNPIDGLAPQVQAYILEHNLYKQEQG